MKRSRMKAKANLFYKEVTIRTYFCKLIRAYIHSQQIKQQMKAEGFHTNEYIEELPTLRDHNNQLK